VRGFIDPIVALVFALLPRRRWDHFDLPIQNVVLASSLITCLGGAALGITGFFAHMAAILAQREWTAPPMMIYVYIGYLFGTWRGLLSLYFAVTGMLRAVAWYIDEPFGDPILTGIDILLSRGVTSHQARSARTARERLEGADEPDRRYDGGWAGLEHVDWVIVSARRKPEWTKGTWVITDDGWFVLGEPFDRPMPNGLRTVYPLSTQNTLEAVRKSVAYQLPPLRVTKKSTEGTRSA
jgi:hypothetical protein